MKTKYKIIYLLSFLAILSYTGCRRIESEGLKQKPEPESLQGYNNYLTTPNSKGSFIFQSTGVFESTGSQVMVGDFRENGQTIKGGPIKFGRHVIEPYKDDINFPENPSYVYYLGGGPNYASHPDHGEHAAEDVFGTEIAIELQAPVSRVAARGGEPETVTVTGSLYIPKEIELVSPLYKKGDSSTFVLKDGFHIKWNEDDKNMKGVLIYLEYDPEDGMNIFTQKKNYPETAQKIITTKDTAEGYIIRESDIETLPNGSWIRLRIARVNYVVLQNGENNYKVGAITTRAGGFRVKHKRK